MSKEWIDMSDKVVIVTGGSMDLISNRICSYRRNIINRRTMQKL